MRTEVTGPAKEKHVRTQMETRMNEEKLGGAQKRLGRREAGATHGANHQQTGCVKARQEGTFKIKQKKHKFKTQTEAGGDGRAMIQSF